MKKLLVAISGLVLMVACGHKAEFTVDADIPAVGTQEITVVALTADGNRSVSKIPAIDGKFDFAVQTADSTDVELFTANKRLLAAFAGRRGEQLNLRASGDSLFIDGRMVRCSFENKETDAYPEFPELELVVGYDSVATYGPEGIWFFSSTPAERSDAFRDSIKAYKASRVRDVYISGDRSQWNTVISRDSTKCAHAMMPDAPVKLRGILTSTPCLIEVDTAGTVLRVQKL